MSHTLVFSAIKLIILSKLIHLKQIFFLVFHVWVFLQLFIKEWIMLCNDIIVSNAFRQIIGCIWIGMHVQHHFVGFYKFLNFFAPKRVRNPLMNIDKVLFKILFFLQFVISVILFNL